MKDFLEKLKLAAEENPIAAVSVASLAVLAAAKLITAVGGYRSSSAYAQDVARRVKASR